MNTLKQIPFSILLCTVLLIFNKDIKANPNHGIYLSVVEIIHEAGQKKARLSVKIFTNDLEDALKNAFQKKFKIDTIQSCNSYKNEIESYFKSHLSLLINQSEVSIFFEKCEKNGNSLWVYFKLDSPEKWDEIKVKADYLMELFPTQSNIVSIKNGNKKRFAKLSIDKPSTTEKFTD